MSKSSSLSIDQYKNEEDDDLFEMILELTNEFFENNPLIKKTLNDAKERYFDEHKLLTDIKVGQIHVIDRIEKMEKSINTRLNSIEQKLEANENKSNDLTIREITKSQARKEIKEFLNSQKRKPIYPSDISSELNITYDLTLEIIEELLKDKKIEIAE